MGLCESRVFLILSSVGFYSEVSKKLAGNQKQIIFGLTCPNWETDGLKMVTLFFWPVNAPQSKS